MWWPFKKKVCFTLFPRLNFLVQLIFLNCLLIWTLIAPIATLDTAIQVQQEYQTISAKIAI